MVYIGCSNPTGGGPTVPGAVSNFTTTAISGMVELRWEAPSSDGGDAIIKYEVSIDDEDTWTEVNKDFYYHSELDYYYYQYNNLVNGTEYSFRVRAVNSLGPGAVSRETATPIDIPWFVTGLTATPDDTQVTLSWTAPAADGGSPVIGYEVSCTTGAGLFNWENASSDTSHTFSGLINGTTYTFRVRAVSAGGGGYSAPLTATPRTIPGQVTDFTATAGNSQVVLSWGAPESNGGSAITEYQVSYATGTGSGTWVTVSSGNSHTFEGLSDGTSYTFHVRAVNAAGYGEAASTSAIAGIPPSAPQNFTATAGDTQVSLTWTAPLDNGSSDISGYQVYRVNGASWETVNGNVFTFTGLTNGTPYTFQVRAVNAAGYGEAASTSATPLSSNKEITAFSFPAITPVSTGTINENAKTISAVVPRGTNITSLTPSVSHTGTSYSPTGAQNFSGPVTYTVTAADGSTAAYTVTVLFADLEAQWARTVQSLSGSPWYPGSEFNAIAVDSDGNVYAAGYQREGVPYFYGGASVSGAGIFSGDNNAVLVKYDSNGQALWARSTQQRSDNITGATRFNAVAVDSMGNVYAAGRIWNAADFGNGVITIRNSISGYNNILLVKYNSDGIPQWAQSIETGTNNSEFHAVAVDSADNVYVAGYQQGPGTFIYGNGVSVAGTATGAGINQNAVLVKYDSNGNPLWARSTQQGNNNSCFVSLAVDSSGVHAAGYQTSNGTYTYGPGVSVAGTFGASNGLNAVLVKYNSNGQALWARSTQQGSGVGETRFNAVGVDGSGNVYAAGYQSGSITFIYGLGVSVLSTYGLVLVKYDSNGTAQWAQGVAGEGTSSASRFSAIDVDSAGNVYVAGYTRRSGTYIFGPGISVTARSDETVVIVEYDPNGQAQWARNVTGTNLSEFHSVAMDGSGNVYAAGYQYGTGTFSYGNGVSAAAATANENSVLVKYGE